MALPKIGNGIRVLLVEDDESVVESVKICFELMEFQVATASNGLEALAMLNTGEPPDCIILDMVMPGMGGREFMEVYTGTVPILVVSGHGDMINAPRAVKAMIKPIASSELAGEVVQVVGDKRKVRPPAS